MSVLSGVRFLVKVALPRMAGPLMGVFLAAEVGYVVYRFGKMVIEYHNDSDEPIEEEEEKTENED